MIVYTHPLIFLVKFFCIVSPHSFFGDTIQKNLTCVRTTMAHFLKQKTAKIAQKSTNANRMHSAQHMEACPGTALPKKWAILENSKFSTFFFKTFFEIFSTFQNCPKIDQRQPNAFRATYGSVSSDGLAHFLDNFGVSKIFNFFFKTFFEILSFYKIVQKMGKAVRGHASICCAECIRLAMDDFWAILAVFCFKKWAIVVLTHVKFFCPKKMSYTLPNTSL
jgi:hypothetical protein